MGASIKHYFAPTPKLFRKIGVAIASLGNSFGVGTAIHGYVQDNIESVKLALIIASTSQLLGWVGKEMTNFFKEEDEQDESQPGN
jgi:hypothetical protein